jgi:AcrR family transcriptional regulator
VASTPKRLGRPRGFDRDEALARAMELFWARGYDATTLTELQRTIGINAPSFYAAFGSKEQLFREALELYLQTEGAPMLDAITSAPTARAAIERLLRASTISFRQPGKPAGCLMVLNAVGCNDPDSGIADLLRERRAGRRTLIDERLRQGIVDGDLPSDADRHAITTFYTAVLDGIAVEARDGASRSTLQTIADSAMAAWDTLTGTEPGDQETRSAKRRIPSAKSSSPRAKEKRA